LEALSPYMLSDTYDIQPVWARHVQAVQQNPKKYNVPRP
jgi:hypothetical protein